MKKLLLFLATAILSGAILAQDTITGWTFPVNSGPDSLNADLGTSQNQGYDLRFQWIDPNDTTVNTVFFTDGASTYAAATTGWENGANQKYWSIKFKAPGYSDFKVSSRQKSVFSTYDSGPGEFKLQWKISGGDYADVPGGTIQVINDWTTGVVSNLPVPITGQGTSSIYLRWLSTTNLNFLGDPLTPNGINMIDDILVTGTASSGTSDILFTNRIHIYPIPNNGIFNVESKIPVTSLEVCDLNGRTIFKTSGTGLEYKVNLGSVSKGVYLLKIAFIDTEQTLYGKVPYRLIFSSLKRMITKPGGWVSLIISGLVLFSVLPCFAGGDLAGKVNRANDSLPLSGAHIRLSGTKLGTISGTDGTFFFRNIPQGAYTLMVTYVGYQDEEKTIRIYDNQKSIVNFLLMPVSIVAPEIEITGKKIEKNILEIPMRINMISSEKIRDNPGQSIPQILDYVSGINLTNTMGIYSNNAVVSMRGLSGDDQGRTLVLLDDIPVNKADEGTVNWHLINKENVEQIKVIKGPGSVIYGSNAMGGIINIKSRIPDKRVSGTATIEYGTYNTYGGRYFIAGRIKNKDNTKGFLYNLNGFYTLSDGYNAEIPEYLEKSDTFTVSTFVRQADIGTKIGYQFNQKSTIDISLNFFNDKRGRGIQIYEVDGANESHGTWQGVIRYSGGKGAFQWKMHAFNLSEYFERLNEFMREAEYNLYLVKSTRNDRGGLLSVSAGPFKSNLLTGGFELRMGSVSGQDIYYTSTDLISNAGNMENYGLFLQDEISLLQNRIEMNLGLRLDYAVFHDGMFTIENPSYSIEYMLNYRDTLIPSHTWLQLSPKLSFQYRFTQTNRIFLSLARGFRAPMLDDLCRTGKMRNGFKISNPALKPEFVDNIELGLDMLFRNKFHISPSFYYSIGHDFMYYVSTGDSVNLGYKIDPVYQKRNISIVDIVGAEIDIGYDPVSWLSFFANYTFAYSRIRKFESTDTLVDKDLTGKFLTYVPMNKASAGVTLKNKFVSCNILWKYIGSRWINDMNDPDPVLLISKFPTYNTIGFRAWHMFFKHLTVALNIDNIFDVRFVDDRLQQSPGRMIRAEITAKF